mmetsp:Transcript_100372/g.289864  ORF Transcript_100372/g.289864 Transcript_100372/m.289864 type:complete len:290 (+) Transcript_100372:3275-4144(+)
MYNAVTRLLHRRRGEHAVVPGGWTRVDLERRPGHDVQRGRVGVHVHVAGRRALRDPKPYRAMHHADVQEGRELGGLKNCVGCLQLQRLRWRRLHGDAAQSVALEPDTYVLQLRRRGVHHRHQAPEHRVKGAHVGGYLSDAAFLLCTAPAQEVPVLDRYPWLNGALPRQYLHIAMLEVQRQGVDVMGDVPHRLRRHHVQHVVDKGVEASQGDSPPQHEQHPEPFPGRHRDTGLRHVGPHLLGAQALPLGVFGHLHVIGGDALAALNVPGLGHQLVRRQPGHGGVRVEPPP